MPRRSSHDARYRQLLKRLQEARRQAGFTQVAVSQKLGQSPNFCSRLETGERRLQVLDLEDLSRLYARPLRYFLPDTPRDTT